MFTRERTWLGSFCALIVIAPIAATTIAVAEQPKDILFHDNYHKAIEEARLTQRPIFLEFRCAP